MFPKQLKIHFQVNAIDSETLGYGIVVILLGLLLRMVATFLAVSGAGLSNREKIFMVLAWLPKV